MNAKPFPWPLFAAFATMLVLGIPGLVDRLMYEHEHVAYGRVVPWGIWVACVEPGVIATPIWDKGEHAADDLTAHMTDEQRSLYGASLTAFREVVHEQTRHGISPDDVAARIEHALFAHRPKGYYLVGKDARFLDAMQHVLPVRARDRLLQRLLSA